MITVCNKRTGGTGEYVGRPTPLGNPFKPTARTREAHEEVCVKYRAWLWEQVKNRNPEVCAELMRLKRIAQERELRLVCWCAPLPCHAEVVRSCVLWLIREELEL